MLIHFTLSPESNIIKVQAGFLTQLSLYCLPILNGTVAWGYKVFEGATQQRVLFRILTGFPFMQTKESRCITKTVQN
jgi:hypothetical protein